MSTENKNETRIYIGNFPPTLNEYSIIKLFQKIGKIKNIEYKWHKFGPKKGEPRGYCFLEFEEPESASKAIKSMNKKKVMGRILYVSYIDENKKNKKEENNVKEKIVTENKNIKTSTKIYMLEQRLKELTGQKKESTNTKDISDHENSNKERIISNNSKSNHNNYYRNSNLNSKNKRPHSTDAEQHNNLKKTKI